MRRFCIIGLQTGILFLFSYVGTWIQTLLDVPIPGSIIGMILLFLLLLFKIIPVWFIEKGASTLLSDLTLLFVPVTVGVMDYFSLFRGSGLIATFIVALSTMLVFVTSGLVSQWVAIKQKKSMKHSIVAKE